MPAAASGIFASTRNADMRLEALLDELAADRSVHSVFLIGQNYSFGQQVARGAREILARKRPDVRIVGDELHPLGQVKDFAPYAAKIKASGADAVITGNWGNDLVATRSRRARSRRDRRFLHVLRWVARRRHRDRRGRRRSREAGERMALECSGRVNSKRTPAATASGIREDFYFMRINTVLGMLQAAIGRASSADPLAVARALSGMRYSTPTGEVRHARGRSSTRAAALCLDAGAHRGAMAVTPRFAMMSNRAASGFGPIGASKAT